MRATRRRVAQSARDPLGVRPARTVGDHFGKPLGEQVADDRAQGVELPAVGRSGQQVVAEPEVAGVRLGLARSGGGDAPAVLLGGLAQIVVAQVCTGEGGLVAGDAVVGLRPAVRW